MNLAVLGTQWGDEGKGKIVDLLAKDYDAVVRFQGGNNAGHTVILGDKTYKFHLVPSGVLYKDKKCVLGNGMVIDPVVLQEELNFLRDNGYCLENLYISDRAHVILPYHKLLDALSEKGKGKIGTTGRGIGPCYSDKIARLGIRVVDLLNEKILQQRLSQIIPLKQKLLDCYEESEQLSVAEIMDICIGYGKQLKSHVADTAMLVNEWIKQGKSILLEGAQGTFLCIDHGTYPYVTSSNTVVGNASTGSGIPPNKIDSIVGVVKAYTTRVGNGCFPTELFDDMGEKLRQQGREFGTTTGRPRRCGWLDLALLRRSVAINGLDEIALTKLDVLSDISPLKICVAYSCKDTELQTLPADMEMQKLIEPVYEELPGWQGDISDCRLFEALPENCKRYIRKIEKFLEVPVRIISVGPERNQTMQGERQNGVC